MRTAETVGSSKHTDMDVAAAEYMMHCEEFLASQNRQMTREIEEGASREALGERLLKITLVNDIIDIGNAARVSNFKSQATRDPELLKQAVLKLGDVRVRIW